MDVLTAIRGRRTIHRFKPDPVPRPVLEEMLEAAVWVPNHKLTEPWRFYVASGQSKERLARLRGELKRRAAAAKGSPRADEIGEQAYRAMAEVPAVVVVTVARSDQPEQAREDYAAVSCAIQNLMLAAWSHGVGVFWGTGPLTKAPAAYELLGIPAAGEDIVGVLFVGYPAEVPTTRRTPVAEKSRWLD